MKVMGEHRNGRWGWHVLLACFLAVMLLCYHNEPVTVQAATKTTVKRITNFQVVLDQGNKINFSWKGNESEGYILYQYKNNRWQRIAKFKKKTNYSIDYRKVEGIDRFAVRGYHTRKKKEVLNPGYESATLYLKKVEGIKTAASHNKIRVEWKASKFVDGYYVYLKKSSDKNYKRVCDTKENSVLLSNQSNCCQYQIAVRGYKRVKGNKIIRSSYSPVNVFTVPKAPKVQYVNSGKTVRLQWNQIKGANYYRIYTRSITGSWERVCNSSRNSCTIDNPYLAENFYVMVKAVAKVKTTEYVGFGATVMVQPQDILMSDQTLFTCGDSICYGQGGAGISYPYMLANKYRLKLTSCASCGATLSNRDTNCIVNFSLPKVQSEYKYAIIEGGINDYLRNFPAGDVTAKGCKTFDASTACGGLETIFHYFRTNYPATKLYYVSVHKVNNYSVKKNKLGLTYEDYLDKYLQICKKYNVTVIDCYNHSELDTSRPANKTLKRLYTTNMNKTYPEGDGLHPTEKGYLLYYMPEILKVFCPDSACNAPSSFRVIQKC